MRIIGTSSTIVSQNLPLDLEKVHIDLKQKTGKKFFLMFF